MRRQEEKIDPIRSKFGKIEKEEVSLPEKMEEIEKKGFPDYLWIDEGKILFLNE